MANTNCLQGIRCPHCGHEDKFMISVSAVVVVTDEGTGQLFPDLAWDDGNEILCPKCRGRGVIGEFKVSETDPVNE